MKGPKTRYRQINLVFVTLLLLFVVNRTGWRYRQILELGLSPYALQSDATIYTLFLVAYLVLLVVPERRWSQLLQVHLFLLFGFVSVAILTPAEIGGDLLFAMAAGLAYRYGLLRRHATPKLMFILSLLISSRFLALAIHATESKIIQLRLEPARVVNQLGIVAVVIVVMYLVFERELRQIRRDKQRLERLQDENNAFVEFAQNVSGLVHDFKNDLGLFDTFGQLLRISENDRIDRPMIERYERYVVRFSRRVNSILAVTRAAHRQQPERIDVADLVSSTVYVFQSNLHFKRVVTFELDIPEEPVWVHVSPAPLTSILENLIRNGCEALVEQAGDSGAEVGHYRLSVQLIPGSTITIRVADNGPGIPLCDGDGSENCLYSSKIAAGYTTKENGSGIGLVTIRRHSERSGIPVDLRSVTGEGTSATISLPEAIQIAAAAPATPQETATPEHSSAQR